MTTSINVRLDATDAPKLGVLYQANGECTVTVTLADGLHAITSPRVLRAYADELVALADRACREEDERTDELIAREQANH